ncbi:MAG: WXG100 family type VII secretion target [Lachnospiraceae bacterium]|nr:WXG100 family type VII secretion target [Lachnospiraceae bacterium]
MSEIANELGRFSSDIEKYISAVSDIELQMQKVYDGIASLNSMWTGTAHDEFIKQFNADNEDMKELITSLNQFKESLKYADEEYNKCENQVAELVNSIRL